MGLDFVESRLFEIVYFYDFQGLPILLLSFLLLFYDLFNLSGRVKYIGSFVIHIYCCEQYRGHLNFDSAGYPPEKHRGGTGHEYVGGDMLKPREADIPALFLVLVVLPLVTYIILGKWSEATKKKARISMLAQLAAEEAHRVETLATATVVPAASSPKTGFHFCARCSSPATTRCARCKSVRYWYIC